MKKILCVLIAIAMMLGCGSAFADIAPFGFTVEQYTQTFSDLLANSNSGLQFTWGSTPDTSNGYPITYGQATNPSRELYVTVHDINGLIAVELDAFYTSESEMNQSANSNTFGQFLACTYSTAYVLSTPSITRDAYLSAIDEITTLLASLEMTDYNQAEIGGIRCIIQKTVENGLITVSFVIVPTSSELYQ